jgi:predicted RNA binding protein YcfA (HicA-like mRNA interferase family)
MVHPDKKFPLIPIPMHPGDIGVGLIRKIIRDVGVSLEQWLDL